MGDKPVLYITIDNHFDPTWRRCFRRSLEFDGRRFVGYADIEQYYIDDNLALAEKHPDYAFEVESPIVLREYLTRKPDALPRLKELAAEGRFGLGGGAGDNVIDTNMVLGESIVRNFVKGILWTEKTLAQESILAIRNDGFGNPSQLPQVLRGCGLKWVRGLSYTPCRKRYWRGLDGSTVCTELVPQVGHVGAAGWVKYSPCSACDGRGCAECSNRGIDPTLRSMPPEKIDDERLCAEGVGAARFTPEELLPSEEIVQWGHALREKYDVRFVPAPATYEHVAEWVERVDDAPADDVYEGELNPNNSGVLVTRIKTKQVCRRQEYALLGAEVLSCMAAQQGATYPRDEFEEAWWPLLFTMFHDAITATHVDAAYEELVDVWADIDAKTEALWSSALAHLVQPRDDVVSVMNLRDGTSSQLVRALVKTSGEGVSLTDTEGNDVPVVWTVDQLDGTKEITFVAEDVPTLSAKTYAVSSGTPGVEEPLAEPVIENARFRVEADENGLTSVFDKKLGREVSGTAEYRPGELILEHDEGSPWATLSEWRPRVGLAPYTRLLKTVRRAGCQRMTFQVSPGGCPYPFICMGGYGSSATVTVTLYDGLERVDFHTSAQWDNYNTRLRVALPVPQDGKHVYGVPFGAMERPEYEPTYGWAGANGDWPTTNWAGVETGQCSVGLLSKGLPSYCIEKTDAGARILLSVLRSPAVPTYLHEPMCYTMTGFDGMRDVGPHVFEYALQVYDTGFAASPVVLDADQYSAGLRAVGGEAKLPALVGVESEGVRLVAVKQSEDGAALVARLAEYRGAPGRARVTLPAGHASALKTNMLEREGVPLDVADGTCEIETRPWEVVTLRFES